MRTAKLKQVCGPVAVATAVYGWRCSPCISAKKPYNDCYAEFEVRSAFQLTRVCAEHLPQTVKQFYDRVAQEAR